MDCHDIRGPSTSFDLHPLARQYRRRRGMEERTTAGHVQSGKQASFLLPSGQNAMVLPTTRLRMTRWIGHYGSPMKTDQSSFSQLTYDSPRSYTFGIELVVVSYLFGSELVI
ncbi:hypothetical protein NW759_012067 [Fusarium solani]|nr:hypothetical protein NW759_012067 [Fusarium solani]